ncbi:copper homeostasis protein CutC [Xanthomonas translucens pv. phlei]|uniref:Copper homeostasis protein cutC homolog n=1 Tax=Xanthomonas graminis pv. phlei TaxID=487906 RepID=A0A0K3A5L2_9XANT|nr:copper homeostasis protein CutC [Xanthomonas translucens pv. phlei]
MRRDVEHCVRLGCDGAVLGALNPAGEVDMDTMRVLTSGARAPALDGIGTIAALLRQADGRIGVMPGAGVSEQNVRALRVGTGARKFHASARSPVVAQVHARHAYIRDLGGDYQRTDVARVCRIVAALQEP